MEFAFVQYILCEIVYKFLLLSYLNTFILGLLYIQLNSFFFTGLEDIFECLSS